MFGVDLGPARSLISPDPVDNAAGYQEQLPILELDDELLVEELYGAHPWAFTDPLATARRIGRFALGHEPDSRAVEAAAALPSSIERRSSITDAQLLADPLVPREIAHEYYELRERAGSAREEKSGDGGSIDSQASNPITTQPPAAFASSRRGS